jgi:hypothetical protein
MTPWLRKEIAMRSVLQTLGLSAALTLSAALAFAQETAPGSNAPDAGSASTPGAAAPASNEPASNEPASGETATKADWPCEQVERPEISIGSVWHGPDPESAAADWRNDQSVAALVEQIAPRRMPQDQAIDAVHRFSAGYKDDRDKVLTAVFAGLFETMSHERSQIIQGIKHFNSRQDSLSQRIQEGWKQMDALDPNSSDPKIAEQRMTLQQTIDWDSRVFDDREHLLPEICQQPSVIEQRLFALSRAIQDDMKTPQ